MYVTYIYVCMYVRMYTNHTHIDNHVHAHVEPYARIICPTNPRFRPRGAPRKPVHSWVLVKESKLSYHNKEIILFTTGPYYGN